MSRWDIVLWAVLPYVSIAVFLVGSGWRYRRDQYRWGARSSQLLESRALKYGSVIFHYGVLAAIGGHAVGILVPHAFTEAVGITEGTYHFIAGVGGLAAGAATTAGFAILVWRRARFARVRASTTRMDVAVFALLALGIVTGMWATVGNVFEEVFYRDSVAPWFRGLFALDPQPELMAAGVPLIFQVHVIAAWALYALWPFSRLVHAWSIPIDFFRRSPIPYRGRAGRPEPRGRAAAGARPMSRT